MRLSPGDRVDRYVLVEPLGEGGQGAVWKAQDALDAARVIALKLVPTEGANDRSLERVRREARALAALSHPALVRCHALFEDYERRLIGLALDFVPGRTLRDALSDPLFVRPLREAALGQIAGALAYLHGASLVHRDLKLDNVLLTERFWSAPAEPGAVKLVDFGIAVPAGNPHPLTAAGYVVGTPPFMAPELLDPGRFGALGPSPASDVFAFGVLGWLLLASGHPTGLRSGAQLADYADAYRNTVSATGGWPPAGPGGPWGDVLRACLAPLPHARVPDGAVLVDLCTRAANEPATRIDWRASQSADAPTVAHEPPAPLEPVPRTVPGAPFVMPPPAPTLYTETPRTPARFPVGASLLGLAVVGVLGVGAIALLVWGSDEAPVPLPTEPASVATEHELTPGATTGVPEVPHPAPRARVASDCSCPSGFAKPSSISPDSEWDLRFVGVKVNQDDKVDDLLHYHPEASVCVRIRGSAREKCQPLRGAHKHSAPALRIRFSELTSPGLEVTLRTERGTAEARLSSSVVPAAICRGVDAPWSASSTLPNVDRIEGVSFFLDPPDASPATCCPASRCPP